MTPTSEKKAWAAFVNAVQFHRASDLIGRTFDLPKPDTGEFALMGSPVIPLVVNSSFALELYLKALIILEAGGLKPTHDFVLLFSQLSDTVRQRIQAEYDRLLQTPFGYRYSQVCLERFPYLNGSMSLETVLPICRDAFALWRYCHEATEESVSGKAWLGGPIVCAIANITLQLRPDWKPLVSDPRTWSTPAVR